MDRNIHVKSHVQEGDYISIKEVTSLVIRYHKSKQPHKEPSLNIVCLYKKRGQDIIKLI